MLLHLLLHLLFYYLLPARAVKETNYIIKHIQQCPGEGFYFTRESAPNSIDPGPCYLCFCQEKNTAICWRRNNTRCNAASFHYYGVKKWDSKNAPQSRLGRKRMRRDSNFGADIFYPGLFQEMLKKKKNSIQCKPYQSTFSNDCPPADWCQGCTVCDCGEDGRWDCHVLKYCPEKKEQKDKEHDHKTVPKKVKIKPITKATVTPKMTTPVATKSKTPFEHSGINNKKTKTRVVKKTVTAGKDRSQKKKLSLRYQIISNKGNNNTLMIIKKNIGTHKPIELKGNKVKKIYKSHENNTSIFTQQMTKRTKPATKNFSQDKAQIFMEIPDQRNIRLLREKNDSDTKSNNNKVIKRKTLVDSVKNELNKRQQNNPFTKVYDPKSYKRYKRQVLTPTEITINANNTTTAIQEEKPTEAATISEINNFNITTKDVATSHVDTFTVLPISLTSTPRDDKDYYKYDLAKETDSGVIPLEKKTKIINNASNIIFNQTTTQPRLKIRGIANETETPIMKTLKYTPRVTTTKSSVTVSEVNVDTLINSLRHLTDVYPKVKDLKFYKRPQLKLYKQRNTNSPDRKSRNIVKLLVNKTGNADYNKIRPKEVGRLTVSKKFNLVKILHHPRCPFLKTLFNSTNTNTISPTRRINNLHSLLDKILKEFNNTTTRPPKTKKLDLIKYWKKLLSKMFKRNNLSQPINRNHNIQTICEHFGPCKVNLKDKELLKFKISKLDQETTAILNIVKINKGLLHILGSLEKYNKSSIQEKFANNTQRLSSILKGTYANYCNGTLSDDQLIQIKYVKKNTQNFIRSVGKFTILLNEVIHLLTKNNDTAKLDNINKSVAKNIGLKNLKILLTRYNSVQNNLMKKVFEFITKLDTQNNRHGTVLKLPEVHVNQDTNNTKMIDSFAKNILSNIKKLKNLAKGFNSTHSSNRSKREAAEEGDAMEYLLTLMEYLLKKKQHPLKTAPVNDGIDLILTAIKNAPDIKTGNNKMLNTVSTDLTVHNITKPNGDNIIVKENPHSNSEDISSSDKSSDEDASIPKLKAQEDILETLTETNLFKISNDPLNKTEVMPDTSTFTSTELPVYIAMEDKILTNSINVDEITTPLDFNKETLFEGDKTTTNNGPNYRDSLNLGITDTDYDTSGNEHSEHSNSNNRKMAFKDIIKSGNLYDDNNTESSSVESKNTTGIKYSINDFDDNLDNANIGNHKLEAYNTNTVSISDTSDKNIDNEKNIMINTFNDNSESNTVDDTGAASNSNYNTANTVSDKPVTEEGPSIATEEISQVKGIIQTENIDEEVPETVPTKTTKTHDTSKVSSKYPKKSKSLSFQSLDTDIEKIDQKSKLEWIVENFGTEVRSMDEERDHEDKRENVGSTTPSMTTTTTVGTNISSQSNEIAQNMEKEEQAKKVDDIMIKKEMSLLNFLDYGTDKGGEVDESSDVGNVEEKYADTFSAYFV